MWHPVYSGNLGTIYSYIVALDSTVNVRINMEHGIKKHANCSRGMEKKTSLLIVAVVTFAKHFPCNIRGSKSFHVMSGDLGQGKGSLEIQ